MHNRLQDLEAQWTKAQSHQEKARTLAALVRVLRQRDPQRAYTLCEELQRLMAVAAETMTVETTAVCYLALGQIHRQRLELETAESHLEKARSLLATIPNQTANLVTVLLEIGLVHRRLADYPATIEYCFAALTQAQEADYRRGEADAQADLGTVLGITGDYEQALAALQQALAIYQELDILPKQAYVLNNTAMVHLHLGQLPHALTCIHQCLAITQSLQLTRLQMSAWDTMGAILLGMNQPEKALTLFRQSVAAAQEHDLHATTVATQVNVGRALAQMQRTEEALTVLHDALELAAQHNTREEKRLCHYELATLYRQQGDATQSLHHFEQHHLIDREIHKETAASRLKIVAISYEMENARKEAEIEQLRNAKLTQEIEQQKAVAALLRKSESQLRQLMEASPLAIQLFDADGTLKYVNQAWQQMWQTSAEEVVNQRNILQNIDSYDEETQVVIKRAFSGEVVPTSEFYIDPESVNLSGGKRWVRAHLYQTWSDDGELQNVVAISEDISERKAARTFLQQAHKLESLGVLAGEVAHSFNNLLMAIMGQTSVGLAKMEPDSPGRTHVQKALTTTEQAGQLAQQMLAYSGKGHFLTMSLDLNHLLEEMTALLQATISKSIRLRIEPAKGLPLTEADASQLGQAVMNLVMNAMDAIGEGSGTIAITTAETAVTTVDNKRFLNSEALQPGPYVMLTVHDNGTGIPTDVLPKIFDPFFSTKPESRGLGLPVVLGIMRGHKGSITVDSTVGEGTAVSLLFPVATKEVTTAAEPPAPDPAPSGPTLILVIDDESHVREAVTDILEMAEIQTITAPDGEAGLAKYRERREQIQMVILDQSMPGMSGDEVLQALREIDPTLPVLMASGYPRTEIKSQLHLDDHADFLQKPFGIDQLISAVQQLLPD